LSPYYAAFDLVLLAAGYNSFHEALSTATPAIFVPNAATRTDDQEARSRWARDHGLAREWDGRSLEQLAADVEWATDIVEQGRVRARLLALPPATGAEETADWIRSCL
jgi:predicted glycosyltransferase